MEFLHIFQKKIILCKIKCDCPRRWGISAKTFNFENLFYYLLNYFTLYYYCLPRSCSGFPDIRRVGDFWQKHCLAQDSCCLMTKTLVSWHQSSEPCEEVIWLRSQASHLWPECSFVVYLYAQVSYRAGGRYIAVTNIHTEADFKIRLLTAFQAYSLRFGCRERKATVFCPVLLCL